MENIIIEGEPKIVTETRAKILDTFKDLVFIEDGHQYFLNGKSLPSVSSITHKFQEPFKEEETAENYALKHGETKEYWLHKWHFNSFRATTLGTRVHAFGESLGWLLNGHKELITDDVQVQYHAETNQLAPIHPKEEAVVKFFNDLPSCYHLVLNEAKVYSGLNPNLELNPTEQYCGTFDMLYWFDGNGDETKSGFCIFDYKTNASLTNDFARNTDKRMYAPFEDLYAESLGNYSLQLSCYQIPLEDIGLKVIDRKLIHLKDDGTYDKVTLPNLTDKLRKIL